MAERTVHTQDAIEWLRAQSALERSSLIASLPDFSEFPGLTLQAWKAWFIETAQLILSRTPPDGVAVFFQSEIKVEGEWIDKGYLITRAADEWDVPMVFHKILCRATPGVATYGKPSYSHLLAFSKNIRPDLSRSTADVVPDLGEKVWVRGMGFQACKIACEFIRRETDTHTIINPFCGQGSILAVANFLGFNAIGIERSPKRARSAQVLNATADGWIRSEPPPIV